MFNFSDKEYNNIYVVAVYLLLTLADVSQSLLIPPCLQVLVLKVTVSKHWHTPDILKR